MDKLYELKEMLCEELEEYGSKDKLDVGGLDIVDKLAHAIKNLDKIIEAYEDHDYSSRGSYESGRSSYAMRSGRGSYAKRDSMGRYSRAGRYDYAMDGDMIEELQDLMEKAPDERTKKEFQKLITKLEGMM